MTYSAVGANQGFAIFSHNTNDTFWFATGVAFATGQTVRSWQYGGFVGTTTDNRSVNPYGQRFTTNSNPTAVTAPAFVTIQLLGRKQPAFCAGQDLSGEELGVLQGILNSYAHAQAI
jgi:hypothetical protein